MKKCLFIRRAQLAVMGNKNTVDCARFLVQNETDIDTSNKGQISRYLFNWHVLGKKMITNRF